MPSLRPLACLVVFGLILAVQVAAVTDGERGGDAAPPVNDAMEVFDIGWNLAHGRGYAFGWDDPAFRRYWADRNDRGLLSDMLAHHGPVHATLARPPLMPVLVAGVLRVDPAHPFRAWRLVDAAAFSAAAAVLAAAVLRRFGPVAAVAVVALVLLDPVRMEFVPGWWTEGLAFDGVAVLAAIVLVTPADGRRGAVAAGVVLGLLCLDRSAFVLLVVPWAAAVGWRRWRAAAVVLGVAVAVQAPWWARNVAVGESAAGRFLPLGTQGGQNLPDEYGDEAVRYAGWWTGTGMTRVWADARGHAPVPPAVRPLWPGPPDYNYAALIHAQTCESTATEIAVADAGQRAGLAWVRSHPGRLPGLFVSKIWSETIAHRPWLAFLLVAGTVGLVATRDRRPLWVTVALAATYAAGIGLTHAVLGRFLVPILPALYVPAAVGLARLPGLTRGSPRTPPARTGGGSTPARTPAGPPAPAPR